eukprot:4365416-Heterocapsa_arctica.AAC.1
MPPGNSVFCCSLVAAADTLRRPCLPCPAPVQLTSAKGAGARMLPQRPCRTSLGDSRSALDRGSEGGTPNVGGLRRGANRTRSLQGSWGATADPQAGPCGCSWGR